MNQTKTLICLAFSFMFVSLLGCSDENSSRSVLHRAGYTDVSTTGWSPLSCGQDDMFSTGFTAKNPAGNTVSGVVCCGLVFKNCTIRF